MADSWFSRKWQKLTGTTKANTLTNTTSVGGDNFGSITQYITNADSGARLDLSLAWHPVANNPDAPNSALLKWSGQLTPFLGREAELERLHQWYSTQARVSVLIVAAEGGMGKTRLAAEFAQALRAKQWRAGFAVLAQLNRWPSLATEGDTLLIIDYPESDIAALQHLMALANRFDAPTHRLRILLLTRNVTDIRNSLQAGQAAHLCETNALKIDSVAVNAYALFESARCATLIASGAAVKPYDHARFGAWRTAPCCTSHPCFCWPPASPPRAPAKLTSHSP